MGIRKLTPAKFLEIAGPLERVLKVRLERDLADCALPELANDPHTDLWTTPKVDSKTVAKLSSTVKEFTGFRLDPEWIQKGGYVSVTSAIADVMAKIREHCVAGSAPAKQSALIA